MSNQQNSSGTWGSPMPFYEKHILYDLYTGAESRGREITSLASQLQREKKFAVRMATLCHNAIVFEEKSEKGKKGMFAWGWMTVTGLKEKVERLEAEKKELRDKVQGLETEKGKVEFAYRALSILSNMWEAEARREGGTVAGLERIATLYKEKLVSKTKENTSNAEMAKTLEAKVKLIEEMNESEEKRLNLFEG